MSLTTARRGLAVTIVASAFAAAGLGAAVSQPAHHAAQQAPHMTQLDSPAHTGAHLSSTQSPRRYLH